MVLKETYRLWWQRPKKLKDLTDDRRVTFLELFYDLVYVVIIAELSHSLATHFTWSGAAGFVFLFTIVWWAWVNGTVYHELHGNNDMRTRVFTFLQMFSVIGMAIFAHNAFTDGTFGFAISFGVFQLILTILWWRTGAVDRLHRQFSNPYSLVFLITTILFFWSAFLDKPYVFYVWGLVILVSLAMPIVMLIVRQRNEETKAEYDRIMQIRPSQVERFGLFTIIVFGEVIIGVVQGVASQSELTGLVLGITALSMAIAIGLWWVYFDFISGMNPIKKLRTRLSWIYLHLIVTMSIAMTGAGILNAIEHSNELMAPETRWLFVTPIAVFLLTVVLLIFTIKVKEENWKMYCWGRKVIFASAVLVAALGYFALDTIWLIAAITFLIFLPIGAAFRLWVKKLNAGIKFGN